MKTFSRQIVSTGIAALFSVAIALPVSGFAASAEAPAKPAATKTMHHKAKKMMHHAKANAEVKAAQEALDKAGYKVKADGMMGHHTRAAIRAYQKKNGLKVTGHLDKETMTHLHAK